MLFVLFLFWVVIILPQPIEPTPSLSLRSLSPSLCASLSLSEALSCLCFPCFMRLSLSVSLSVSPSLCLCLRLCLSVCLSRSLLSLSLSLAWGSFSVTHHGAHNSILVSKQGLAGAHQTNGSRAAPFSPHSTVPGVATSAHTPCLPALLLTTPPSCAALWLRHLMR
ncbi:uncharacterized protein MONBRDRAFT_22914 [Monosiga brevicollis MX1]|uniref:Uncharacterized protein n=1 Tax=Monosiga brevicollis TaxID=81824 RepID=A9USG0_MONBE|nr:uncharacterized protein MONBRDRAFT_22914 [Monosiga brevicollis MX1]EDQ91773.1 predicted protein [Monosiga brevicollis MX1]|eukprot:XP_001743059.1 hypothetical protein [Monosiga brevicollis MX1]